MVDEEDANCILLLRIVSKWRGVCYTLHDNRINPKALLEDLDLMSKTVEEMMERKMKKCLGNHEKST